MRHFIVKYKKKHKLKLMPWCIKFTNNTERQISSDLITLQYKMKIYLYILYKYI